MSSILTRYLDAEALTALAHRPFEPRGLVLGSLAGGHRSPLAGFAVEFSGHREYVRGDDPRHIDWRLYYTRDKLFIKQYEMETNFVCHLVLDVSASMRYGDGVAQKLAYAARLATTLAYAIIRQNDKVSLATVDDIVRGFVPPGHTLAQVHRMMEHLSATPADGVTRLPEALSELVGRAGRRGILMIFSDLLCNPESLEAVLQQFRFRHHEIVLFHTLHHDEREFPLSGMVRFEGLEAEPPLIASAEDIRTAYQQALDAHTRALEELCQRNRVEFVAVDTSRPAAEVLVEYINHRTRIRRR